MAATFNNFKEILGGNLVRQHKTTKFDIKGEQTTTLYKVYQNRLNRLKRVEKLHRLQSQPIFSVAFKMKWCEPFDFPTILEFLGGRYLDLQMEGTLISQNF